jgi:hypothetical protein
MAWPTDEQERLLRAALAAPADAGAACRSLRGIDARRLDQASRRLLPLLYANLRELEVRCPLVEEAEREYRRTASRNAALFDRGRALIQELATDGVATLVLKGAALAGRYYRDAGLRPMTDIDILIPIKALFPALAACRRAGWTPKGVLTSSLIRTRHAVPFGTADGFTCDLHWRVFAEPAPPGADEALWAASTEMDFHGASTRALSPADQLLHVCVHGARWAPVPAIWWITDAIAIIRAGDLSWSRLVSRAVTYRFVLRLREALHYLSNHHGAAVPGDVRETLRTLPVSALERFEWRVIGSVLGGLPTHWCNHRRSGEGIGMRGLLGFPLYLRDVWGLKSAGELPRAVTIRAVARVAAALRGLPFARRPV